jgi:hypothetical protein
MQRATTFAYIVPLSLCLFLAACSVTSYRYEPLDTFEITQRALSGEQGDFQVRAAVPGRDETRRLFGASLYDRGIQPVWLEVTNRGSNRGRLVLASIDLDYFSPLEVAYMFKNQFSKQGWKDMERYLYENALPRRVLAGETVSGFVFTQTGVGTKAFNVDIFFTGDPGGYEQFTFFVEVPGFEPDHAKIDFRTLYSETEVKDLDIDSYLDSLDQFPCCSTNRDGTGQGRPLQLFFVAEGYDLLRALLRAGWEETSYERDERYLKTSDYVYGRPPDAIFRKRRDKTTERAGLGLWLSPMAVNGKPVWVAQYKHIIGRRFEIGERLLGANLDPDTTDGRNYVLQDMWYSQSLLNWAWSGSGVLVSQSDPNIDFNGNPWFTKDKLRLTIWISGNPVAMSEAKLIGSSKAIDLMEKSP